MTDPKDNLSKVMEALPTCTALRVIDRNEACGFVVSWSETGYGFGEFEFFLDKKTGEFGGNIECMDPDHVGRILMRLVGATVCKPE